MEDRTPVESLRAATETVIEAQAKIEDVLARLEALERSAVPRITQPETLAEMINVFDRAIQVDLNARAGIVKDYAERLLEASVTRNPELSLEVRILTRALRRAGVIPERVQI